MRFNRILAIALAAVMLLSILGVLIIPTAKAESLPPSVIWFSPDSGATNISTSTSVQVTFSEAMNASSVEAAFNLSIEGMRVSGSYAWSDGDTVCTFTPSPALEYGQTYLFSIENSGEPITDRQGHEMASSFYSQFTTQAAQNTTRPNVESVTPSNGTTDFNVTWPISVTFSESMDAASVEEAFSLSDGAANVGGKFFALPEQKYFSFTPSAPLRYSTEYTISIGSDARTFDGVAMSAPFSSTFITQAASVDSVPPRIWASTPGNSASNVSVMTTVELLFSEAMDRASVESAFSLSAGGATVPGAFSWRWDASTGEKMTFTPSQALQQSTEYTAELGAGPQDLAGNALTSSYKVNFTTQTMGSPPTVVGVDPPNGTIGVDAEFSNVMVTFSEPMNRSSVESAFNMSIGGQRVSGTFIWYPGQDQAFTFRPSSPLMENATYYLSIGEGGVAATDMVGDAMAAPFSSFFTTEAAAGSSLPTVISTSPNNGAVNVSTSTMVTLEFSEAMRTNSVEGAFSLTDGISTVSGTFSWVDNKCTFTPSESLRPSIEYTIIMERWASDLAGNYFVSAFVSSFTTEERQNAIGPYVTWVSPENGAVKVSVDTLVMIRFSEEMIASSVEDAFSLTSGGTTVAGQFDWVGANLTFSPSQPLRYSTEYTITIGTGAKDLDGNSSIVEPFTSSFITMDESEPPRMIGVTPANGTTDADRNTTVQMSFSEPMNETSVREAFSLSINGTGVNGDIYMNTDIDGHQYLEFTPSEPLRPGTQYTVSVSTEATDLAGNTMETSFEARFITKADVDTTSPTIYDAYPDSLLSFQTNGNSVTQSFGASYSDDAGVASATVTLDGNDVSSEWGVTASYFAYNAQLEVGQHIIILTVKDAAGNEVEHAWEVTINQDIIAPVISNITPASSLTLYTKGTSVTQTFTASYSDDRGVTLVLVFLDDVNKTEEWATSTSSFSQDVQLGVDQHTLVLKVKDAVMNEAVQTWEINVIQDTTPPTIAGYADGQQIKDVTATPSIGASFSDAQSGVDPSKTTFGVDGQNLTSSATKSPTGITYPTNKLSNGWHTVTVSVMDNAGNTATVSWTVQVNVQSNPGNADTTSPTIQSIKSIKSGNAKSVVGSYFDKQSAVSTASVKMTVDGADVTSQCAISGTQISYPAASLAKGNHAVHLELKDNAGNLATVDQMVNVR